GTSSRPFALSSPLLIEAYLFEDSELYPVSRLDVYFSNSCGGINDTTALPDLLSVYLRDSIASSPKVPLNLSSKPPIRSTGFLNFSLIDLTASAIAPTPSM